MNDEPRQELCRIVTQLRQAAWDEPDRLAAMLRDACGAYVREIHLLALAARQKVPQELLGPVASGVPVELVALRLADKLRADHSLDEAAAKWAVAAWASCLGITLPTVWASGTSTTATPRAYTGPSGPVSAQPQPWVQGYWKTPAAAGIQVRTNTANGRSIRHEFRPFALPANMDLIEPTQTSRVKELARIGLGSLRRIAVSPGGALLALATNSGVELRASDSLGLIAVLDGTANDAAFNNTGRLLAVARPDGKIQLWDLSGGDLVLTCQRVEVTEVTRVLFSPDGQVLAAVSRLGSAWTVDLWDVGSGSNLRTLDLHSPPGAISGIAFSADGKDIFCGIEGGVLGKFKVDTGLFATSFGATVLHPTCIALTADNRLLAAALTNTKIMVYRTADASVVATLSGNTGRINDVTFSPPDGQLLVAASADATVRQWWVGTGNFEWALVEHTSEVTSVLYSRDGQFLYTASKDGDVHRYRASDGLTLATLRGHSYQVNSLAFSPDGATLALGCANNSVQLCRTSNGEITRTLVGHNAPVTCVAFSPDGRVLASASDDTTIKVWDAALGTLTRTITAHTAAVTALTFTGDSQHLVSASDDKSIKISQVSDGALVHTMLDSTRGVGSIQSIACSPDRQYIAFPYNSPVNSYPASATQNSAIYIYNGMGVPAGGFTAHPSAVESMTFSPDSQFLASGSEDKTIKLWRVAEGLGNRSRAGAVAARTLSEHTGAVNCLSYAPDGRVLASGSADGSVRLWRSHDGMLLRTLNVGRPVLAMVISPNSQMLATGSIDGVTIWGIDSD